jgi:sortase A
VTGKSRLYRVLLAAGAILLIAGAAVKAVGLAEDYFAGKRSEEMLRQLLSLEAAKSALPSPAGASAGEEASAETVIPAVYIDGYEAIGVLSVPSLDMTVPLLSSCDEERLKVSVCRYQGEIVDGEPERLVIVGHNYKSLFGRLPGLSEGDEVVFQPVGRDPVSYQVSGMTEVTPDDHEGLEEGDWDMTLITCNADWSRRILIRCAKAQ